MTAIESIPGVRELWRHTVGEPDVTIGVVEGLPDLAHPCFAGAELTVLEPSWLPASLTHEVLTEHGTFVASVLFGQHHGPVRGLAPRCRGIVVPALRDQDTVLDPLNAARAIEALVDAGVHVIHFTAAHPTRSDDADDLLKRAVRHAERAGVLIVAPTGNDYGEHRVIPGILPEVLAVGAHRDDGTMFRFSNWGPRFRDHGIVAPGDELRAAAPGGGTTVHKGTSIATPIVSGVAALLVSVQRRQGRRPDPLAVRAALLASARPCTPAESHGEPDRCLAGRLDVAAATRAVLSPGVVTAAAVSGPPVYALGSLGYDFGTEARRDAFRTLLAGHGDPLDPRAVANQLAARPPDAAALIWTLELDGCPVYAIEPVGAFAAEVHRVLARLLAARDEVDRVCLPGRISGRTARLLSGTVVPTVEIERPRGLSSWDAGRLTARATAALPDPDAQRARQALRELLARIVHDCRNLGTTARDRALNFAATNAVQAGSALAAAAVDGYVLDGIAVAPSPFGRAGRDCWDVRFRLVDPDNNQRARRVCRFTVDVSDPLPLPVGEVRTWLETRGKESP
ncbi:S8 family serine peptidase [Gandjariella thermophila]|uniref:Peptidase S8/S53 domain-containing protein n=1 Tax=Gandjariella thermophila TaxID=1931992 RepID=A0A4D4JBJ3_9PSEU|nr:S8 family serine peptidase [Gandjariella thermophila]GDY31806.1 hypothetical protein GTS_34390 [Gandjariella thermophila]